MHKQNLLLIILNTQKTIMKKFAMITLFAGAFAFASCNSATNEENHDDHDHDHSHDGHDHSHDADSTLVLDSLAVDTIQ